MNKIATKAVIFDRDGVIINTEGVLIDSVRQAFAKLGFTLNQEDIQHIAGRSYDVYKYYFLEKWKFDFDEYRSIQKEIFSANLGQANYFEHTIDLIKSLHAKRIPMGVTTSAGREGTMQILEKAGVKDLFNVIVTKEDCQNLKPNPEPYLTTANKLGIMPTSCVVLEDTVVGVESAKNAGMKCIAIPNEYTRHQDFSLADMVLESAAEVECVLEFI